MILESFQVISPGYSSAKMTILPPKQGGVGDKDADGRTEEDGNKDGLRLEEGDLVDDGATLGWKEDKGEGIELGAEDV